MKKKLPVITLAQREEAARLENLPGDVTIALANIASAARDGLMALSCTAGLCVLEAILEAEVSDVAGPKGRHNPERTVTRNGTAPGSVVLGGRTVAVRRPRAIRTDGSGELSLDSWSLFSSRDLLSQLVVERMLAGVATRRHVLVGEPVGEAMEQAARATSKSAVSRRFVSATKAKLAELLTRDLSKIDVSVVMIDGVYFAGRCCVVALVITTDGTKIPVGLYDGDTENTVVVTGLLADLVARGLRFEDGILCVIDGSKALAAGVRKVFGDRALVQRCVLHKRRNVVGHLDDTLGSTVDRKLGAAFNDLDPARGLRVAKGIARQLEADHPSAAASLLEGLDDMFTVRRLGVSDRLARSLSCTNAIESMISVIRKVTGRVTKWKDTTMVNRWAAAGMLEAERSFRRIKGHGDMQMLVSKVHAEVARRVAEKEGGTVTPTKYDQAVA
ncbi:MAG: IS256 family transposase [Acidimicrobiales bacterium]